MCRCSGRCSTAASRCSDVRCVQGRWGGAGQWSAAHIHSSPCTAVPLPDGQGGISMKAARSTHPPTHPPSHPPLLPDYFAAYTIDRPWMGRMRLQCQGFLMM